MPTYLTYCSSTNAARHDLVPRPEVRGAAARSVIEANGGRLPSFDWMLGDRDGLAIDEARDAIPAAESSAALAPPEFRHRHRRADDQESDDAGEDECSGESGTVRSPNRHDRQHDDGLDRPHSREDDERGFQACHVAGHAI